MSPGVRVVGDLFVAILKELARLAVQFVVTPLLYGHEGAGFDGNNDSILLTVLIVLSLDQEILSLIHI